MNHVAKTYACIWRTAESRQWFFLCVCFIPFHLPGVFRLHGKCRFGIDLVICQVCDDSKEKKQTGKKNNVLKHTYRQNKFELVGIGKMNIKKQQHFAKAAQQNNVLEQRYTTNHFNQPVLMANKKNNKVILFIAYSWLCPGIWEKKLPIFFILLNQSGI